MRFIAYIKAIFLLTKCFVKADKVANADHSSLTEAQKSEDKEQNKYPRSTPLNLEITPHTSYHNEDKELSINTHYKSNEPEASDVLSVKRDNYENYLHADLFFDVILNGNSLFSQDLSREQRQQLLTLDWVAARYCMDCRSFYTFKVGGRSVEVFTKYFGAECLVSYDGNQFILISRGIYDSEVVPLPDVITYFDENLALIDTAQYDEDNQYWEYLEPPML